MKYKHTSSNIKVKKKILKKRFSNVCLYSMKLKHTLSNIKEKKTSISIILFL